MDTVTVERAPYHIPTSTIMDYTAVLLQKRRCTGLREINVTGALSQEAVFAARVTVL